MSTQIGDLWPQLEDVVIRTPSSILKEQASLLARRTSGLVEADVTTTKPRDDEEIFHRFALVAPTLDNYRYNLFTISHPIFFYPIRIVQNSTGVVAPKDREMEAMREASSLTGEVDSEKEFLEWLKEALGSAQTRRILSALISQSQG